MSWIKTTPLIWLIFGFTTLPDICTCIDQILCVYYDNPYR
jgi:hypothetical protein